VSGEVRIKMMSGHVQKQVNQKTDYCKAKERQGDAYKDQG